MKRYFLIPATICLFGALLFSSCEGCVKKVTKKATATGMAAVEGISEAVNENGDRVSEKATDALGKVAEGVGRSLDRQLEKHAEDVAATLGRTLVQTVDGLDKGLNAQYYDEISYESDFGSEITLEYFGKIKKQSVIDAYFIITQEGTYACKFEFTDKNGKTFLIKESEIQKLNDSKKYSRVSFALNPEEETGYSNLEKVKISVKKK